MPACPPPPSSPSAASSAAMPGPNSSRPGASPPFASFMRVSSRCSRRSEEHTSELQSLMRISYAVFCLKKKKKYKNKTYYFICQQKTQHVTMQTPKQHIIIKI